MTCIRTYLLQWLDMEAILLHHHPFKLSLLLIISVLLMIKLINIICAGKKNLPPSPPKLPIIGNLHQLGSLLHRSLRDLSKQYGPLMLIRMGSTPTLVVSSAEMAREIFKTHGITFANRPLGTAGKVLFYGCTDIGFSPYGNYYREIRKMCVTELLSIKRVKSFSSVRREETALMIETISQSSLLGVPIKLGEVLHALNNDIICRCTFGRKPAYKDGKHKMVEFSKEMVLLLEAFSFGDLFPWLGWVDEYTGLVRRLKRFSAELDTFFDETIDEHVTRLKHDATDGREDFIDLLLDFQKNETLNVKFTRDNVKAVIMDMFAAGSDAAPTTIEWALAELVKKPNLMRKTQEEVRRVVGKKLKVDEEDINQMNYLKSVVKETLRLHPPAALLIPRESSTSAAVGGYHVPSKTRVFINAWAIQRDPRVWNNPEEFIPDRFLNPSIKYKGQGYEYIPFGAGRRMCPGKLFSLAVVEFVIANLLYWFDWEMPHGSANEDLDMTENFGIALKMKIPLQLIPISHSSFFME